MDDKIMIDGWLDELPMERHLIAFQRALQALGYEYTLDEAGKVVVDPEETTYWDHDDINAEMKVAYAKMYADEILTELEAKGVIKADHVNDEGSVIYVEA